jgi:flavin-binding protein dodecin
MATTKIIELIGSSDSSWEGAAQAAVTEAVKTLKGVTGVDVIGFKGKIRDGKIVEYRANVKIAFTVDSTID